MRRGRAGISNVGRQYQLVGEACQSHPNASASSLACRASQRCSPEDILPIFQRWIQEGRLAGMLIDVIDYKHVPDGPGIMLIADEADIAYDLMDGEIGLHYIRKRGLPDTLDAALSLVFSCAIEAARALEAEAPGDIAFDFSSAKSQLPRSHELSK